MYGAGAARVWEQCAHDPIQQPAFAPAKTPGSSRPARLLLQVQMRQGQALWWPGVMVEMALGERG